MLARAALNFPIVTAYCSLGDIVFFSVLEMQSLSLSTAWSCVSFVVSMVFIVLSVCLLCLYCWLLFKYHSLKPKSPTDSPTRFTRFIHKHKALEVLYIDFVDTIISRHGFLFVMTARDIGTNAILVAIPSLPLVQSVFLCSFSVLVCSLLLFNNPFHHRLEQISQLFLELCILLVNVVVVVYASMDAAADSTVRDRDRLGSSIIIINNILNTGCAFIMMINIIIAFREVCRSYIAARKNRVRLVSPSPIILNNSTLRTVNDRSTEGNSTLDILSTNQTQIRRARKIKRGTDRSQHDRSEIVEGSANNAEVTHTEDTVRRRTSSKKSKSRLH